MADNQPIISPPEEWRPVVGYEGIYEVSDHGRVRALDRVMKMKNGVSRTYPGKLLKNCPHRAGYFQVGLHGRGGPEKRVIHSLVAEAFIGPRPEGQEVRHLDGNPQNNNLSNFAYGTRSENQQDSIRHGTKYLIDRTHCPRGHALEDPNLVRSQLKRGHRSCLACARAFSYVGYHQDLRSSFKTISDKYHNAIIREATDG